LNKKVLAIAIATIMILGLFTALTPTVQAADDQRTCILYGASPFCVFLHPGVEDSYKPGWSHTLDTLWGNQSTPVPGEPDTNPQTRQVFDKYLDYSILASASDSVGDLQFDFTIPPVVGANTYIDIYVPPEFTWLAPTREESIWTDVTNDYQYIWTSTRSSYDPIAPNWVRVRIGRDQWFGQHGVVLIPGTTYHVRLFDLKAPSVAGLYHFKIYVSGVSIGAGNYPFVIVKNELNPAWVQVTVRTHAYAVAGWPFAFSSGSVLAEGTTPEGRAVSAIGYWGPMEWIGDSVVPGELGAMYRLYLFGLAEGTYTLKAEASGFNPTVTERFSVYAGQ